MNRTIKVFAAFCIAWNMAASAGRTQPLCPGGVCPSLHKRSAGDKQTVVEGKDPAFRLPNSALQTVVQIDNRGHGGGSGVYLGDRLVLTCDHLFRQHGKPAIGRIIVSFANGEGSEAQVLGQDPTWDLAMLRLAHAPKNVPAARWTRQAPKVGDTLVSTGFGFSGRVRPTVGRLKGYTFAKGKRTGAADTMQLAGAVRAGDSGGPIFDATGCLAGILWGTNGREVVGTQVGRCQWICRP